MNQAHDRCLRCGKAVAFITNEDGTFCPQCGWSHEAAQRFAKKRPSEIRRHFLKSLLKGGCHLILAVILIWLCFAGAKRVLLLGTQGKESLATIVSLDGTGTKRSTARGRIYSYYYTITFAGHIAKWSCHERIDPGTRLRVLFLPEAPDVFVLGQENDSVFGLARQEYGIAAIIFFPLFIVLAIAGLLQQMMSGIRVLAQKHAFETEFTKESDD